MPLKGDPIAQPEVYPLNKSGTNEKLQVLTGTNWWVYELSRIDVW